MTEQPRTEALDALWERLAADIHAHGYSVRDAIAAHRPLIEAAIEAPSRDALAEAAQRLIDSAVLVNNGRDRRYYTVGLAELNELNAVLPEPAE